MRIRSNSNPWVSYPPPSMSALRFLAVQPVRNGLGIVALKSSDEVWSFWKTDPRKAANCFRYDADRYLSPQDKIGAFANHSCNPNVRVVKQSGQLFFQAIKSITACTEITHDYSTLLGADDSWIMPCNCGEVPCRKKIRSFHELPTAILKRYLAIQAIPDFILATR
jgi:SET domain